MIAEFARTDRQAEAILNMRLRSLRKLEEMELKSEQADLIAERAELAKLVESPARQRTRLKRDLNALRDRKSVVLGKSVSVRVDIGGRRMTKKKNNQHLSHRHDHSISLLT